MNTRYCHNCGGSKINIEAPWCETCLTAVNEAREFAIKEGGDPGQAQRNALWRHGHDPHRGRADSRTQVQRVQFDQFIKRISVQPGAVNDPRRTG